MYYTIYQTTNLLNRKIYVGQHQTTNIYDSYLGSGDRILAAIKKYGIENFKKEVLFVFLTDQEMDIKEKELVDYQFICRKDTYNVVVGGKKWNPAGTVVVKYKGTSDYFRIPSDEFYSNRESFDTINDDRLWIEENGKWRWITSKEYDPTLHKTASAGRVSVVDNFGNTMSAQVGEYDLTVFRPVLGGIVSTVDGVTRYVTRSEFDDLGLAGIHKGKVTAKNKITGEVKHVSTEVFRNNRDIFEHNTTGFVTGRHKTTGLRRRFTKEEATLFRKDYSFSTTGQVTVFFESTESFVNIPKEEYNPDIHRKASDVKFILLSKDNDVILHYWGGKKRFLADYKFPVGLWQAMLDGVAYKSHVLQYKHLDGFYFNVIDWKKEYGLR